MFDPKTDLTGRLTDAADLLIDFATLGEYGLEPVGRTSRPCEVNHRSTAYEAQESFSEALFPNRHRGDNSRCRDLEAKGFSEPQPRGPRRNAARKPQPAPHSGPDR